MYKHMQGLLKMIDAKNKELPKTKKVMMLWDEELHAKAKEFAEKHNMSISELSREAIKLVIAGK